MVLIPRLGPTVGRSPRLFFRRLGLRFAVSDLTVGFLRFASARLQSISPLFLSSPTLLWWWYPSHKVTRNSQRTRDYMRDAVIHLTECLGIFGRPPSTDTNTISDSRYSLGPVHRPLSPLVDPLAPYCPFPPSLFRHKPPTTPRRHYSPSSLHLTATPLIGWYPTTPPTSNRHFFGALWLRAFGFSPLRLRSLVASFGFASSGPCPC